MLIGNNYFTTKEPVPPITLHKWVHWCFVKRNDIATFYSDGRRIADIKGTRYNLLLNGTLILGQEQDEIGGGFIINEAFRGYLSQVNIWSSILTDDSVSNIANCGENMMGDVFSSDYDNPEIFNVTIQDFLLTELCDQKEISFVVPTSLTFYDSSKMCYAFGTTTFAPRNKEQNIRLQNYSKLYENNCPSSFWVGINDEIKEGVWITDDNETLEYTNFDIIDPVNTERNCAVVISATGRWLNERCDFYERCFACNNTYTGVLSLRGLCFQSQMQSYGDVRENINTKPYFHGWYGHIIIFNDFNQWNLIDTVHNKSIAVLILHNEKGYPVGRQTWQLINPVCGYKEGHSITLALSRCYYMEFMCSDGSCVDSTRRCNAMADCPDQSDEEDCKIVRVPNGYLSHIPPRNEGINFTQLALNISIEIQRFKQVVDAQHFIEMEFLIRISWKDPRVKYNNLKFGDNRNKLSQDETLTIWQPAIYFHNNHAGHSRALDYSVLVKLDGEALPMDYNSAAMGQ